jgi:hypothetical protein
VSYNPIRSGKLYTVIVEKKDKKILFENVVVPSLKNNFRFELRRTFLILIKFSKIPLAFRILNRYISIKILSIFNLIYDIYSVS